MSEDDKIDHHLRDRLKDQEHPVSDRVWTNIKSTLPPEDSNRGGWGWKNWLTTSAIVATTMVLIYYWNTHQEISESVTSEKPSANTAQISPAVSSSPEVTAASMEKNTSPALTTTSLSAGQNISNRSSAYLRKSKVSVTNEKNVEENNIAIRSNPADKYSIAYNYVSQHPDQPASVLPNNSSAVTKPNIVSPVSENANGNIGTDSPKEITTSDQNNKNEVVITTNEKDPVNTVSENSPENTGAMNNTSQSISVENVNTTTEITSDGPYTENTPENSTIVMNNQEYTSSESENNKDLTKKEKNKDKEEKQDKEGKQDENDRKEKKDKMGSDQEKEKSILPKPVFSADAYIMPAYTGVTTSFNTNDPSYKNQISHKNAHDRTWVTLSYGGRFNYHMTDAIEFSAGLHYQKIEERISATRSIDTLTDGISAQSRYTLIAIPLGAAYNFNAGKLRVRLGAACNLQYTLTSETYFYNEQKKDLDLYNYDAKGMNLALQFSGALIYPVTQHVNILMEPTLQYNLDDLNHSTMFFKEKPYLIGLKTGVRVMF